MNSSPTDGETTSSADMLSRHSFDWLVFSRYLELLPERVQIRLKDVQNSCDVQAVYLNADGSFSYKFALLLPDEAGLDTRTTEIHRGLHDAFRAANPPSRYIGFRSCGRMAVAPLFLVSLLYAKFGHGLFKDGEHLPSPAAAIEAEHGQLIHKVRTDAPSSLTRKTR